MGFFKTNSGTWNVEGSIDYYEEKNYGFEVENPIKIGMSFYGKEIEILVKE